MFELAYNLLANNFFLKIVFRLTYFCKMTKKENNVVLGKEELFRVEGKMVNIDKQANHLEKKKKSCFHLAYF